MRGVPTVATLPSRKASISILLVVARAVVVAVEAILPGARIIRLQLDEKLYRRHRDMEGIAANAARRSLEVVAARISCSSPLRSRDSWRWPDQAVGVTMPITPTVKPPTTRNRGNRKRASSQPANKFPFVRIDD